MSGAERRLDRLTDALTPRQKAILFLHEYKVDNTRDPRDVVRLAQGQTTEFNRYIDILRFVNGDLADIVLILREQVAQQELRFAYLQAMRIAGHARCGVDAPSASGAQVVGHPAGD